MNKINSITIRNLQIRLLEIIDYIDELCKDNDIEYFLIGGSALGAVRHKGFIPWDDDFDIAMTPENYSRFIEVCSSKIDKEKFYFQKENSEFWPLYFSKIKLNNTVFKELDGNSNSHPGIFIDVFCLEHIAEGIIASRWQWLCSKIVIAQTLNDRGYRTASLNKKIVMKLTSLPGIKNSRMYFLKQVRKYNSQHTSRIGNLFGGIGYKAATISKEYYGKPIRVEFEGRMLPVPEKAHEYLTEYFGEYMKLPPKEQQIGHLPMEIKL